MSAAFARSMRALEADHFQGALWGVALLALLLAGWLLWLLLARVALYEVSHEVTLAGRRGAIATPPEQLRILAAFPPNIALGRLRPGQPAHLSLDGFPRSQYGTLPATVVEVPRRVEGGQVLVELALSPDVAPPIPLQDGMTGSVEIETERLSPAALLLRAVGKRLSPAAP